ncbi:acyltransferase [Paenibacillus koleovorans]|uniref:acyltransferase n=1 Tax=Paenibacillus koleovorans TaxID=121608 RepID=UPI000FD7F3D1|nr:acyltransferase [Paenibacillus koleovorans]
MNNKLTNDLRLHPHLPDHEPEPHAFMKRFMEMTLSIACKARGLRLAPHFAACGEGFTADFGAVVVNPKSVRLGDGVYLGRYVHIPDIPLIVEDHVLIGPYVTFVTSADHPAAATVLREGCWLAAHVTLRQGVTIGAGSTVAAGSYVLEDVPDRVLVGGNPAAILKSYDRRSSSP